MTDREGNEDGMVKEGELHSYLCRVVDDVDGG